MEKIILPALRGLMGNWVYYTCLMNLKEISERVNFAMEIHKNTNLSSMIQRVLNQKRRTEVANYLETQPERLFNSLVVATYGGEPHWVPLDRISSNENQDLTSNVNETVLSSIGFLVLSGEENLFALDGQHRLSGIKSAVKNNKIDSDPYDEVSIILVSHKTTPSGIEKTRRLFTTLNKTAKPVSKGDIIALDEDDVMAITTRWLIEETNMFNEDRIAFVATNNMPARNATSITTIGNLYDLLTQLFTAVNTDLKKKKADLQKIRPDDDTLQQYFLFAKDFFTQLGSHIPEVKEFFDSNNYSETVKKYRNENGGSIFFRPIGLTIFMQVIAELTKKMDMKNAIELASKLPRNLHEAPYANLLWDVKGKKMLNLSKVTAREALLFMLGHSKFTEQELLPRYRKETGDDNIELPARVIAQD